MLHQKSLPVSGGSPPVFARRLVSAQRFLFARRRVSARRPVGQSGAAIVKKYYQRIVLQAPQSND